MGIDIHGLNFLRYAKNKKFLGETLTIGRQGLHVREPVVKNLIKTRSTYKNDTYCEALLIEYFGATNVQSIDHSDYEKATHVHNMNDPIPQSLVSKYDTVIDGGCLEHIYNAPQALRNCSQFLKPGGQIIHMLPANNFCGHGFWQFSPELFFSLYSEANGYQETEVFLADLSNTKKWFFVHKPENGTRVNATSSKPLYVLARTVLKATEFNHSNVQQSDYIYQWHNSEIQSPASQVKNYTHKMKDRLKKIPLAYKTLSPMYNSYLRAIGSRSLTKNNPGLAPIEVNKLIHSN
jgi:SAM-dependent methyltransferase